jgi:hypothetical protein
MAKKTITKEHPITAFRKANEARDVVVKASMKKMQTGGKTTGKPTADSTAYYKDEAKFQGDLAVTSSKFGLRKQAEENMANSRKAYKDASRQKFKGKPGFDKNGFPIKK